MSRAARVAAQAKLNLFLQVHDREADGFHRLDTLFCRLALADTVTVRSTDGPRSLDVTGTIPAGGLGPVERNLAWRAAAAYADAARWPGGFAIELVKAIPVGGGLGGGSADAGAVLRALDAISPRPLGREKLHELAATLGADVPFLTGSDPLALAWGYGEQLRAVPPLPPRTCWLIAFEQGVPTADAYRWLDESRQTPIGFHRSAAIPVTIKSWGQVSQLAANDFEAVVLKRRPDIAAHLKALRAPAFKSQVGARTIALMSGSGATVFCLPEQDPGAPGITTSAGERVIVTQTADRVAAVDVVA
ncbi:MAG: 4-(cytidine 5'-diphospho)-2-C-methyl-D-erythritol kinase [Gemmatimonadetes bacterium]|nr:4-(cytidine 5'-diphospho)-2-C-methyl-D-erythritol kinase [Gemmatimonadota bacterium]